MKPTANKIIVKAYLDQKETMTYGSLKLFVPSRGKLSTNGREVNPTLAEVVTGNKDLKQGDLIVVGHNVLENISYRISKEEGLVTIVVPVDRWILGKLDSEGELVPLNGNTIGERIEQIQSSILIVPDSAKKMEPEKIKLKRVSPDEKVYQPEQECVMYQYSDYEIHYSFNGQDKSAVTVFREDLLAIVE